MLVRGASSWLIVRHRTVIVLARATAEGKRFYQPGRASERCVMSYDACAVVTGGRWSVVNQKPSMHYYSTLT